MIFCHGLTRINNILKKSVLQVKSKYGNCNNCFSSLPNGNSDILFGLWTWHNSNANVYDFLSCGFGYCIDRC